MKNQWLLGGIIVVILIAGLAYFGFHKNTTTPGSAGPQVAGESTLTDNEPYFSNDAKVMEFYQDTCEWCIKESAVLQQLANAGYRVKPMNIGPNHPENQKWWTDYNVQGTPTFVAANGDHLAGYQNYDALKKFLDEHK